MMKRMRAIDAIRPIVIPAISPPFTDEDDEEFESDEEVEESDDGVPVASPTDF